MLCSAILDSKIFKREINTSDQSTVPGYSTLERRRHDSVGSSTSGTDEPMVGMSRSGKRSSFKRNKIKLFFDNLKQNEKLMRDSNVLLTDDGQAWDWDIIVAILRVCT